MKHSLAGLLLLTLAGCSSSTGPSPLYPSYFLSSVDGKPLPAPSNPDGTAITYGGLSFDGEPRPHETGPSTGTVTYTIIYQRPDHSFERVENSLGYTVADGVLRINLCPSLALCLIPTELVGPFSHPNGPLVLTHYLGGAAQSVYRFFPSLPD